MNEIAENDPQIVEGPVSRFRGWARRQNRRADTCLVFVGRDGDVFVVDRSMPLAEALRTRPRRYHEIDLAVREAELSLSLACHEPELYFAVSLRFTWQVVDAARIVRDRRRDVGPVCERHLLQRIQIHDEEFGVERRVEAERAVRATLAGTMRLPEGIAIGSIVVALRNGDTVAGHLANRALHRYRREVVRRGHDDEGVDLDAGIDRERKVHVYRREQELEEERHLRKTAAERAGREAAEVDARMDRVRKYHKAMEMGNITPILLLLERNPDDIGPLIELLVSQREHRHAQNQRFLLGMHNARAVDIADIEPLARRMLKEALAGEGVPALETGIEDSGFGPPPPEGDAAPAAERSGADGGPIVAGPAEPSPRLPRGPADGPPPPDPAGPPPPVRSSNPDGDPPPD